ncbi:hypothetical protein CASFOL_037784 [Castilleja foliolosa]|uniref:Trichome birefringence-like C-terminal domain-containing protein n=1 Tax=Castilleja foliolosa TaxID=1961234 RepID=A0ABD3BJS1_9LAMI
MFIISTSINLRHNEKSQHKMAHKAWETFLKFHHLIGITLVALAGAAFYLNHSLNYWNVVRKSMKEEKNTECDFFSGRWVYDNVSYPLYNEEQCSFMDHIFACQKNGRKDFNYRHWRWQPRNCDIPRFNGKEYNTTIGFYWSPFLVESNCDDYLNHRNLDNRVVKIEAIEKHARHWNDADILIFDSYAWWLSPNKLLWGSFESPDAIYKQVETKSRPYEMGLSTWSDWLEMNINRTKTKLFFMSVSPNILRGDTFRHCYNKSEPIPKNLLPSKRYHLMGVLEASLENLRARGINVEYIRITRMSEYRNDAHPSIYRATIDHLSEENKKDPTTYTDCLHWCLPGVPDIWNQILYDYIMKS